MVNVTRLPGLDVWWTGWRSSIQYAQARFQDGYPFVVRGEHTILCLLSKVGSTSWHRALLRALPGNSGYSKSLHIVDYPPTTRLSGTAWQALIASSVPRVIIIRNPYERLLSAYLNKVSGKQSFFTPYGFRFDGTGNDTKHIFANFVHAVTQPDPYSYLPEHLREAVWDHFRPQSSQCELRRGFSYDYVLPVEQMSLWFSPLARVLHLETEAHWIRSGIRSSSRKLDDYYTADTIATVSNYSAGDLAKFCYPRWEPTLTSGATYVDMLSHVNSFRICAHLLE
mmetsp:Transcript_42423/g.70546  ORF Transcript_42423/g.70546 Transcript_42423/m.70546 type:complete len:282 (+) Transcript_42423:134-979(+)|eukprot:CAMPEP_0119328686 /NCGR_PEP_ID=MMETSP1333-20130426/74011_1 /TAXON_ID=418940 /ORGANISM="Scyphosphaera apsteinii, Strain RCC1455" /LENGTH=281 /DNA_ID=CAMNT_0007337619 /DNA_START=112 /DNA_END=957 /DNA_ORIENTATION=+